MINININHKNFLDKTVLKNINISVKKGEFLSIIGPSGCGKSTLLNIISSLDNDYDGEIILEKNEIGIMFQEPRLLPWLSVKQNLKLVQKNNDDNLIFQLLELVGLEKELNTYPNKLSGGMARRVSLVRAFLNKPSIILLDEPFISLDLPTSQDLKKDFLKFCKAFNPTVILVTHDLSEAISLSDSIIFLGGTPTKQIYKFDNNKAPFEENLYSPKIDIVKNEILDKFPNILKGEIHDV